MRSCLFQLWHIGGESKTKKNKTNIKACTKCATACHKSTQHKLDQLFSSCHEHTGSVQLTQSLCIAAVVSSFFFFHTAILPRHRAAFCRSARESSVSRLGPIGNTKYMFRLLRGCGYRCLCVRPRCAGWRQNATILRKQSLIVWLRCSSEETWRRLFCGALL